MRSFISVPSLTLAFLLTTATIVAQEKPSPPEPGPRLIASPVPALKPTAQSRIRVGVALEGGGALGLAHIGVLKWFEEHHIPVDYIAGTSMGGLVGGLYSTGKSANDLENFVHQAHWSFLLRGGTPYRDLSFRRKEDAREVPNNIRIGLRNGPTLPPGLNTGQQISLLIDWQTLPYSTVSSFDELPIPFRCVATELVSGNAFVFQDGPLSRAMRATMSIPGVFDPVREGNKVFVDGGLVDNLPTDVVRKMGADVVIAVHLQISATSAEDLQSVFSILGRSVRISIAETELRGMESADLVVAADVRDYSTMDYDRSEPLIQRGLRNLPATLPDDVLHDQFDFEPTWEEKALEWNRQQMQAALAEVNRIELEEQREWLVRQNERLATIALEIDETERRQKLSEEMEKRENWWKEVSEREKEANEKILAHFQNQLDGGVHASMVARAEKAKKDMDRDNARLERLAFLKRGVLRGTRKPAAGRLAY